MLPREWWEILGDGTSKLKRFVIQVLTLTYSSCGYDYNWSSSEMVIHICHSFWFSNFLYLLYIFIFLYRIIQKEKQATCEDGDHIEVEQVQIEGDGRNVEIIGPSSTDPNIDNSFYVNVDDAHLLSKEELDGDEKDEDIGNDIIKALKTETWRHLCFVIVLTYQGYQIQESTLTHGWSINLSRLQNSRVYYIENSTKMINIHDTNPIILK